MTFSESFKPRKAKVIVALIPLLFPILHILFSFLGQDQVLNNLPLWFLNLTVYPVLWIEQLEQVVASPFETVLKSSNLWESSSALGIFSTGPTFFGILFVTIIYAVLIYLVWSLVAVVVGRDK